MNSLNGLLLCIVHRSHDIFMRLVIVLLITCNLMWNRVNKPWVSHEAELPTCVRSKAKWIIISINFLKGFNLFRKVSIIVYIRKLRGIGGVDIYIRRSIKCSLCYAKKKIIKKIVFYNLIFPVYASLKGLWNL